MANKKVLAFFLFLVFPVTSSYATWVWSPEAGKFVNADEQAGQDAAEEKYNEAMRFYKEKNLDETEERIKALLKTDPGAKIASEAQYRLGVVYEEKGDYRKAFESYKTLLESYPQSARFNEVIEREFRIGNVFFSGKKGKFAGLEILPALPQAVSVFQNIVKSAPYSEFGDKAQFQLGLTFKKMGRYRDAVEAFQTLIDQYPKSDLIPQGRFQLAESSYLRSASEFRNQRALDEASQQVGRLLQRNPDEATSEKMEKLRQIIDEKNAEKNYRIGAYYEQERYLDSALIYYQDVAKRYPETKWGHKAGEKLKTLKNPADYLVGQEKEIDEQMKAIEEKIKAAGESEKSGDLKADLKKLKDREKTIEKNKKETLKVRHEDWSRRQRELKQKMKNLKQKQKLLKRNPSEDLKRALDRWEASLATEQDQLEEEKKQLKSWHEELGVEDKKINMDFLPFIGEGPTEVEKIRAMHAKKLYKLSTEKKEILDAKEYLYKELGELHVMIDDAQAMLEGKEVEQRVPAAAGDLKQIEQKLNAAQAEITSLQKQVEDKNSAFEKKFGKSVWKTMADAPTQLVSASTGAVKKSLDVLNPFDSGTKDLTDPQQMGEARMHLKEKIASQQNIVDTLSQAFNAQLAFEERQRLLKELEKGEKIDPQQLRKTIRALEKKIRSGYEEIDDRSAGKRKLIKELDALLEGKAHSESGGASKVVAPVVGTGKMFKAFIFGLPNKEVEVTKSAAKASGQDPNADAIRHLHEEIELQSLLIDGKSREIGEWQKDLEVLKAKAALSGGYKFRSAMVRVPYIFLEEAIDNAKKVVPKKRREEILINRLNQETQKLEAMRGELKYLEGRMRGLPAEPAAAEMESAPEAPAPAAAPAAEAVPAAGDEKALKKEIEDLAEKLKTKRNAFEEQRSIYESQLKASGLSRPAIKKDKNYKAKLKDKKKLENQLEDVEKEIKNLIARENEIEKEETAILEKRITQIDRVVQKVSSKVVSQDLLTERQRMEERLTQLASRRDFLTKELERFRVETPGPAQS